MMTKHRLCFLSGILVMYNKNKLGFLIFDLVIFLDGPVCMFLNKNGGGGGGNEDIWSLCYLWVSQGESNEHLDG